MDIFEMQYPKHYTPLPDGWVVLCDGSHCWGYHRATETELAIHWNKYIARRWVFQHDLTMKNLPCSSCGGDIKSGHQRLCETLYPKKRTKKKSLEAQSQNQTVERAITHRETEA